MSATDITPLSAEVDEPLPTPPPEVEEEVEREEEPSANYESPGIFDGSASLNYLNCRRCGSLILADKTNISRHDEMHENQAAAESFSLPTSVEVQSNAHEGTDLAMLVRESMKEAARSQGLRQIDLAKKADVSQKHLSQMFTGNAVGSMEAWSKLAAAIDRRWSIALVEDE